MMSRILAFAASTRSESFNKKLVAITAQGARQAGAEVTLIDLKDFPLPLFDQDLEAEQGMPENGKKLKEPLARQLGASDYIDSQSADPAAELAKLGGAKVVLATVTHGPAMSATVGGLGPRGRLMVLGAAESLEASPLLLLMGRRSIEGWYSGTSIDAQNTLAFSVQSGVRSMNEVYPLERAAEAYDRMLSGKARFRVVLTMGK